jgi:hypothetical protein
MPPASSQSRRGASDDDLGHHHESGRAAGRSTLTSKLPARGGSRPAPVVEQAHQSRPAAHHEGDDPFGLHLTSKASDIDSGGGGEIEAFAPPSAKSAKSAAPKIDMLMPVKTAYQDNAPYVIQVHGEPNSTAVVYVTHYYQGNVQADLYNVVSLDPAGFGVTVGTLPVLNDGGHHAVHARASTAPGVFSALRVAEFDTVIETKGGGV